jgi:DNA-binding GntR family transcriptional regulator
VFDDKLIRWVWRNTERALAAGDVSNEMERILQAVNNGDKKVAQDLINDYNLEVV